MKQILLNYKHPFKYFCSKVKHKNINKLYINLLIVAIFILKIRITLEQANQVGKMLKSHYLPSLEVKVHAPDEFQPKMQVELRKIESEREKKERELMQQLEKDFNSELDEASQKILKIIKEALSLFEDDNLLKKSAEYAINPPMIIVNPNVQPSFREISNLSMTKIQKDTMETLVNDDKNIENLRNPKVNISLGDGLEKSDSKINESNNKTIFKKSILNNEDKSNKKNNFNKNKFLQIYSNNNYNDNKDISKYTKKNKIQIKNSLRNKSIKFDDIIENSFENLDDKPIDLSLNNSQSIDFNDNINQKLIEENVGSNINYSFLSIKEKLNTRLRSPTGKYSKPISVKIKLPEDPDNKIISETKKIESERVNYEKNMFTKAKEEFKLISQITIKELQMNLAHELIPFQVVAKGDLKNFKDIVDKNFPKKENVRFKEISNIVLDNNKYPYINKLFSSNESLNKKTLDFNKFIYSKIANLFSNTTEQKDINNNIVNDKNTKYTKNISQFNNNKMEMYDTSKYINKKDNDNDNNNDNNNNDNDFTAKKSKNSKIINEDINYNQNYNLSNVKYDYENCVILNKKFPIIQLNCNDLRKDYHDIQSFLETYTNSQTTAENKTFYESSLSSKVSDDDFINVKFSAAEESYPTIEKVVAQTMTRRDLAEKFERLKILEFETNLQKAENEMIQDILHEYLYKIMAKYGPAVEGMKEHIK